MTCALTRPSASARHAGQSLGAWLCHGITLELEGDANDYVAKVRHVACMGRGEWFDVEKEAMVACQVHQAELRLAPAPPAQAQPAPSSLTPPLPGPVWRRGGGVPASRVHLQGGGEHHRGQCGAVRWVGGGAAVSGES